VTNGLTHYPSASTYCLRSPHYPSPIACSKGYVLNCLERREVRRQQGRVMRAVKGLSSTDEVLQGLELDAGDRRSLLGLAALWLMEQRTRGIARDDLRNN